MPTDYERLCWAEKNLNEFEAARVPNILHVETAIVFMQAVAEGLPASLRDECVKELRHNIVHPDKSQAFYAGEAISRIIEYGEPLYCLEAAYMSSKGAVEIEPELVEHLRKTIAHWRGRVKYKSVQRMQKKLQPIK